MTPAATCFDPRHTSNDGVTTDPIDRKGRGSYRYRVCREGSGVCSNEATITFQ